MTWHTSHFKPKDGKCKGKCVLHCSTKTAKNYIFGQESILFCMKTNMFALFEKIRRHTGCSKSRNRRICGGINDYDNVESEILTWWWGEHFESRLKVALVDSRDSQTSGFPLKEDEDIFVFEYIHICSHICSGNPGTQSVFPQRSSFWLILLIFGCYWLSFFYAPLTD